MARQTALSQGQLLTCGQSVELHMVVKPENTPVTHTRFLDIGEGRIAYDDTGGSSRRTKCINRNDSISGELA
jgi:hypothetical protein